MLGAVLATLLFSISVIAASRSTLLLGANLANFGRIAVAVVFLGLWAFTFGVGLGGGAFPWFFLSGMIGFGVGDMALFHTFPRLGPRLASLMINCLAAPFGAVVEWAWLGTELSLVQIACGIGILTGVALALASFGQPGQKFTPSKDCVAGIWFGTLAGFGQGMGAVISRKAYAVASVTGSSVDGGSAAFQRILGGLLVILMTLLWTERRRLTQWRAFLEGLAGSKRGQRKSSDSSRPTTAIMGPHANSGRIPSHAWKWVVANALAGPTIGVGCYQWALSSMPSGLVLAITSTTPLVVIPFAYWLEGDRPSPKSLFGAVVAVAGVIALALSR